MNRFKREDIESEFARWYAEHTRDRPELLTMPGADEMKLHLLMAFGSGVFIGGKWGAEELEERIAS